jgi:ubiquinone/menaquinone biosynthesis C-methylase UbiE
MLITFADNHPSFPMLDYDLELSRLHPRFMHALDIRANDHVLDIGCGAGQTTRDVARISTEGHVIGIDVAETALRRARRLTSSGGLHNAEYVCGDAAHGPFCVSSFDVVVSRFGTMFFADALAAFTRIRQLMRNDGRLTMMVWQNASQNEWAVAIDRAVRGKHAEQSQGSAGASAFSLGDLETTTRMLQSAGFTEIAFGDVRESLNYGADAEAAFKFVSSFATVTDAMQSMSNEQRDTVYQNLRDLMASHATADGVLFQSAAWIVSARVSNVRKLR